MSHSPDTETVKDLLGLLCSRNKRLGWKMRCIYTDGKNNSVMEIKIYQYNEYQNGATNKVCRIAFNPANGQVSQMKYRKEFYHKPGSVIDVLLDIINAETHVAVP